MFWNEVSLNFIQNDIWQAALKNFSNSPRSSTLFLSSENKSRGWKEPRWFVFSRLQGPWAGAAWNACAHAAPPHPTADTEEGEMETCVSWYIWFHTACSLTSSAGNTLEALSPWNTGIMSCWISSVVRARRVAKDPQQGRRRWQETLHFVSVGEFIFPTFSNKL